MVPMHPWYLNSFDVSMRIKNGEKICFYFSFDKITFFTITLISNSILFCKGSHEKGRVNQTTVDQDNSRIYQGKGTNIRNYQVNQLITSMTYLCFSTFASLSIDDCPNWPRLGIRGHKGLRFRQNNFNAYFV